MSALLFRLLEIVSRATEQNGQPLAREFSAGQVFKFPKNRCAKVLYAVSSARQAYTHTHSAG